MMRVESEKNKKKLTTKAADPEIPEDAWGSGIREG